MNCQGWDCKKGELNDTFQSVLDIYSNSENAGSPKHEVLWKTNGKLCTEMPKQETVPYPNLDPAAKIHTSLMRVWKKV